MTKYCKGYEALQATHEPFFIRPGVISGRWAFHFHDVHGIPMEFLPELIQEKLGGVGEVSVMFCYSILEMAKRDKLDIEEAFCKFWNLEKGQNLRGDTEKIRRLFEQARS